MSVPFCKLTFLTVTWLTVAKYLSHKWSRISTVCRSHNATLFSFMSGFVTNVTRRVSLVEQEIPTHPEHLSSPWFFVGFVFLISSNDMIATTYYFRLIFTHVWFVTLKMILVLFMLLIFIYVIYIYLCYWYLFMLLIFIHVIDIYLRILVSNMISISNDVRVV
jgi:hypothetical protein